MYNALNSDLNKMWGGQISSKNKPLLYIWILQQLPKLSKAVKIQMRYEFAKFPDLLKSWILHPVTL